MKLTAQQLANTLVAAGYPDDEIRNVLLDRHPEQDPDDLIAEAREGFERIDRELAEGEAREADAARAAEHDTSRSMHPNKENK